MKFLKVLPKEKYNLKSACKRCVATFLRVCNLIKKETPTKVCSCENLKSFRNSFFIEQLLGLLLNYVLVSEENFLKRTLLERLPLN